MLSNYKENILSIIERYKEDIAVGYSVIRSIKIDNISIEQFLAGLNKIFELEESAIDEEKKKSYNTDYHEKQVVALAEELIHESIVFHNDLEQYDDYSTLLRKRHIAFGFYEYLYRNNKEEIYKDIVDRDTKEYQNILQDKYFNKILYVGLAEFYSKYYGSFADNEEAIELLCYFYPKNIVFKEELELIVGALYRHICNAGTPSDRGYAYNGIELIKKFICNLPIQIVDMLLKKYELFRVINDKVYRHQIYEIIDNSVIEEKEKYKFTYLDHILLANRMNDYLYEKNKGSTLALNPYYFSIQDNLSSEKLGVIKDDKINNMFAFWTNRCSNTQYFVIDNKKVIVMSLNNKKKIIIKHQHNFMQKIWFDFNYKDWLLDDYNSKKVEQKLYDFIYEKNNTYQKIDYNNLNFSMLYLNNYRGIEEQLVDFDHRFSFEPKIKKLKKTEFNPSNISHFYGEKIYSLSCIVGKNGTGKSSTVDFLRGTFFKMIYLINEDRIKCENGYVSEEDYRNYELLDKRCQFFIAFSLGVDTYYLTNIEKISAEGVKPFIHYTYKSSHELSKVIYFSNMLSANQDNIYDDEFRISKVTNDEKSLANSLNDFRQIDYSEAASFIQRKNAIDQANKKNSSSFIVNKEICYQLAFLSSLTKEKLIRYLDIPIDKELILKSKSLGKELIIKLSSSENNLLKISELDIKPFLEAADSKIGYFSSGQYAKFSFLAKLYWFLEGYSKYIQYFKGLIGSNVFSNDESLVESETALIFIDEGELYYHPEWQRNYISTLIECICEADIDTKLQIVITTNSPFIISDILSEDIVYLSKKKKDFECTFGQNIHKLLKDNFFMSYTIGEYSKKVIENIMSWLYAEDPIKESDLDEALSFYFDDEMERASNYEKIHRLIDKIGETIYREKLLDMLNKSSLNRETEKETLLRQKYEIERKLRQLESKV